MFNKYSAQSHYVELPENSTCHGCTIRLLRQVPEFAPNFQFISCADVDIVSKHQYVENCNGHGYVIGGGRCTCYSSKEIIIFYCNGKFQNNV
jgi:hypothetical protein